MKVEFLEKQPILQLAGTIKTNNNKLLILNLLPQIVQDAPENYTQ